MSERGRLLGIAGNLTAAEDLIWPEHLRDLNSYQTYYALWELYAATRCEATFPAHNNGRVWRLAASPDYSVLATTGLDPGIVLRDIATFGIIAQIEGPGVPIQGLAFSPAGLLAYGTDKGRVALIEPHSGKELAELVPAGPAIIELLFDHRGERLLASRADGVVLLLNARVDVPEPAIPSDEPTIAGDGVTAVNPRLLEQRRIVEAPARATRCGTMVLHPARDEFAMGCADARIRIWSLPDLAPIRDFPDPENAVQAIAYSPDGTSSPSGGSTRNHASL